MQRLLLVIFLLLNTGSLCLASKVDTTLLTPFERSNGTETATYAQTKDFYKMLFDRFHNIMISDLGMTDIGLPLRAVYYTKDAKYSLDAMKQNNRVIILINNDIHPGEPDGVDACMMLIRDAATGKLNVPENIVLAVIPMYNIGGALNRNTTGRANQNGPASYGFRGNARNLDLNRDFAKCDADETRDLEELMTTLNPDLFIDNHVSDGADYQHIMTLLTTQHDKLGGETGAYMYKTFTPLLYKDMKKRGYDMVPYVNDFDKTPDHGWREFYDPPRFSSGYASLFHSMAYVPETHMLKPFNKRVKATYDLMLSFIRTASERAAEIKKVRAADSKALLYQKEFALDWRTDTTRCDSIQFKGYEAGYKESSVSGLPRLYYDEAKPYTRMVPFYDHFVPTMTVTAPVAYIIPKTWVTVIGVLKKNGVRFGRLQGDTSLPVTAYHIDDYETLDHPYEKHYMHKNVRVTPVNTKLEFTEGDYVIPVNQPAKRYLVELLEPTAPDAFFAWNYFDGILQQKEYFSDYVFEDVAAKMLERDTTLKALLVEKRKQDPDFAKNANAQLEFVYKHSTYMETGYLRYPVYRLE